MSLTFSKYKKSGGTDVSSKASAEGKVGGTTISFYYSVSGGHELFYSAVTGPVERARLRAATWLGSGLGVRIRG